MYPSKYRFREVPSGVPPEVPQAPHLYCYIWCLYHRMKLSGGTYELIGAQCFNIHRLRNRSNWTCRWGTQGRAGASLD